MYSLDEVPSWVTDPAGECLMHTTGVIRARMERRKQALFSRMENRFVTPAAPSVTHQNASTAHNSGSVGVDSSATCAAATASPSPVNFATATVIPVATKAADDEPRNDTPATSHSEYTPSSPPCHVEPPAQQLSGSESDDTTKPAPSHSMLRFYSCAQLKAMQTHVQQVRALTQYLTQGEKIAPNSMSSRVQQLRASIRTELLTSLAVLQCELNDLFPCLK